MLLEPVVEVGLVSELEVSVSDSVVAVVVRLTDVTESVVDVVLVSGGGTTVTGPLGFVVIGIPGPPMDIDTDDCVGLGSGMSVALVSVV